LKTTNIIFFATAINALLDFDSFLPLFNHTHSNYFYRIYEAGNNNNADRLNVVNENSKGGGG
jgi:hypothetical protein